MKLPWSAGPLESQAPTEGSQVLQAKPQVFGGVVSQNKEKFGVSRQDDTAGVAQAQPLLENQQQQQAFAQREAQQQQNSLQQQKQRFQQQSQQAQSQQFTQSVQYQQGQHVQPNAQQPVPPDLLFQWPPERQPQPQESQPPQLQIHQLPLEQAQQLQYHNLPGKLAAQPQTQQQVLRPIQQLNEPQNTDQQQHQLRQSQQFPQQQRQLQFSTTSNLQQQAPIGQAGQGAVTGPQPQQANAPLQPFSQQQQQFRQPQQQLQPQGQPIGQQQQQPQLIYQQHGQFQPQQQQYNQFVGQTQPTEIPQHALYGHQRQQPKQPPQQTGPAQFGAFYGGKPKAQPDAQQDNQFQQQLQPVQQGQILANQQFQPGIPAHAQNQPALQQPTGQQFQAEAARFANSGLQPPESQQQGQRQFETNDLGDASLRASYYQPRTLAEQAKQRWQPPPGTSESVPILQLAGAVPFLNRKAHLRHEADPRFIQFEMEKQRIVSQFSPPPEGPRRVGKWTMGELRVSDGLVPAQSGTNQFATQEGMSFGSPRDVSGKHIHRIWEGQDTTGQFQQQQIIYDQQQPGAVIIANPSATDF